MSERKTGRATVARVLFRRITAIRSLNGSDANSSWMSPNFEALMDGTLITDTTPARGHFFFGDGGKNGESLPVDFEGERVFLNEGEKKGESLPVWRGRFLGVVIGKGSSAISVKISCRLSSFGVSISMIAAPLRFRFPIS